MPEPVSARCEWSREFGDLPLSDEGLAYWVDAANSGHYPPKRIQAELLRELAELRRGRDHAQG